MGVSAQFYGRIEKGAVGVPAKSIKALMRCLNITPYQMHTAMLEDYSEELKQKMGMK